MVLICSVAVWRRCRGGVFIKDYVTARHFTAFPAAFILASERFPGIIPYSEMMHGTHDLSVVQLLALCLFAVRVKRVCYNTGYNFRCFEPVHTMCTNYNINGIRRLNVYLSPAWRDASGITKMNS